METIERQSLTEYCKDFIKDHICNYIGQDVYGCDLAYTITEGINADGSCTYSTYEAKEYLKSWWDDCGNYWQWENDNFGEHRWNPFDNPEAYMVCMVIEGVNTILQEFFNEHDDLWNGQFELTQELTDEICNRIKNAEEIEF